VRTRKPAARGRPGRRATAREGAGPPPVRFEDVKGAHFVGARGKPPGLKRALAAVGSAERRHGVRITVVDARAVCGAAHLASAVHHARGAAAAGEARARDPRVEIMLYLSGQRQIEKALARAGVGAATSAFGFVAEGRAGSAGRALAEALSSLSLARDDTVLAPSRAKLRRVLGGPPPPGTSDFEALALENTAVLRLE